MRSAGFWMLPGLLAGLLMPLAAQAQAAGHVTGVGGVFVTSKDPKALVAWYRDVLGIAVEPWGGAMLRYDAPGHPPMLVWTAMRPGSDQIAPSPREFMLNFAVDDLDAMLARLEARGVKILKRTSDATGKFAWILDRTAPRSSYGSRR